MHLFLTLNQAGEDEPPAKMSKLMIVEERDEDKYEYKTVLKCWRCNPEKGLELPELSDEPQVKKLVTDVMQSLSSARQSEVKAWEEDITACEHTLMLEQHATGHIEASGMSFALYFVNSAKSHNGRSRALLQM